MQRLVIAAVWLALVGWTLIAAPPGDTTTPGFVLDLFAWKGEPLTVAVFNALGVWPLVYGALLLTDGPEQRLPAWPFVVLSMGVGGFVLLPYLVVRTWGAPGRATMRPPRSWLVGRPLGVIAVLATLGLAGHAALGADLGAFAEGWHTVQLVHVMSIDFLALTVVAPLVIADDARRRGVDAPAWLLGWVPLLGPAVWWVIRPALVTGPTSTAPG